MATRQITHFKVRSDLFDRMCGVLNQLPAQHSRLILNDIEAGGAEPIYASGDLGGHKRTNPPAGKGRSKKKAPRKKLAKKKGAK